MVFHSPCGFSASGDLMQRPFRFAPFEFKPEMIVFQCLLRAQLAGNFARDADRRFAIESDDLEDPQRVFVDADGFGVIAFAIAAHA